MLRRGVIVSHETVRRWCAKFGQAYADGLRRRRPRPGDKWHLDEVFVKINGDLKYLWRAVDQDRGLNVIGLPHLIPPPPRTSQKHIVPAGLTLPTRKPCPLPQRQIPPNRAMQRRIDGGGSPSPLAARAVSSRWTAATLPLHSPSRARTSEVTVNLP
jgi:hypothetical protein